MTTVYLTSQFYCVGDHLSAQIPSEKKAKTVFITTPIKYKVFKDSELAWHYKNRETLKRNGFITTDYDLANKTEAEITADLAAYQVMYVEGGNPFSTLKAAQHNNFIKYVRSRIAQGMIYLSESAGSVLAGIDINANSRPGKSSADSGLTDTAGIGLINAVFMPHWGQASKRSDYLEFKYPQTYHEDYPYFFLPNNHYLLINDQGFKIIHAK